MYLFQEDSVALVTKLQTKFNHLYSYYSSQGLYERFKRSYNAYYNNSTTSASNPGNSVAGEQGEFVSGTINHFRNIMKHIYTLSTSNKLVFDCLAQNSDIDSLDACKVGNSVLEYYFYHKMFEQDLKSALEMSLIFGAAFLGVLWEPNVTLIGQDEHGFPVYKGEPKFKYFSPFDVILEPYKDNFKDQNWVVTREYVNKWDLCAMYPELEDELESLPRIRDLQNFTPFFQVDEDTCWLYKAYHKPTPALPNGRYTEFCDNNLVLVDKFDNPYQAIPIIPVIPEKLYGGSYGHTVAFDLIGLQDAVNFLHSTVLSNQQAFGSQNIAVPQDADCNPEDIPGGLKLFHYKTVPDAPNGGMPMAMNLCQTPKEIFEYEQTCVAQMEAISGVNSAQRGSPGSQLNSGTAIALVTAQAQSFNSVVDACYSSVAEQAATALLGLIKKYVTEDEEMAIVGKSNRYAVTTFSGSDVDPIKQVKVVLGNPLSKTLAGKLEVAQNLLQGGLIKSIPDYLQILETGNVEGLLDKETAELSLIQEENDMMLAGKPPQMVWIDSHINHINEHKVLLSKQDVRMKPQLVKLILGHIQAHVDQLEEMSQGNPMNLAIALNQPIPLPGNPGSPSIQGAIKPPQSAGVTPPGQQPEKGTHQPAPPKGSIGSNLGKQTAKSAADGGAASVAESGQRRAANEVSKAEGATQAPQNNSPMQGPIPPPNPGNVRLP